MKKPINKFYHFILHILTSCSHKEKYDWIQNRQKKKTKKPDLDEEEEKPKGIKSKRDTSKDCKTVFVGNLPVNTDKKVSSFNKDLWALYLVYNLILIVWTIGNALVKYC